MNVNGLIINVIVFGGLAIAVAIGLVIVLLLTGERADPFRHLDVQRPADDPQEWTGPMLTGSTGAEKRMRRYFHDHGQILRKRASDRTRKVAAVLDARRPRRSWIRRPGGVTTVHRPQETALLEPLPAGLVLSGEHDAPVDEELLPGDGLLDDEAEFSYSGDNTTWTKMRTELFAMLNADGRS